MLHEPYLYSLSGVVFIIGGEGEGGKGVRKHMGGEGEREGRERVRYMGCDGECYIVLQLALAEESRRVKEGRETRCRCVAMNERGNSSISHNV